MRGKNKKRVDFSVRPRAAKESLPANADQWVQAGEAAPSPPPQETVPQKRLTLNLPASLHTAFKGQCVLEGVTIQDKVQALIQREVTAVEPPGAGEGAHRPLASIETNGRT